MQHLSTIKTIQNLQKSVKISQGHSQVHSMVLFSLAHHVDSNCDYISKFL